MFMLLTYLMMSSLLSLLVRQVSTSSICQSEEKRNRVTKQLNPLPSDMNSTAESNRATIKGRFAASRLAREMPKRNGPYAARKPSPRKSTFYHGALTPKLEYDVVYSISV